MYIHKTHDMEYISYFCLIGFDHFQNFGNDDDDDDDDELIIGFSPGLVWGFDPLLNIELLEAMMMN